MTAVTKNFTHQGGEEQEKVLVQNGPAQQGARACWLPICFPSLDKAPFWCRTADLTVVTRFKSVTDGQREAHVVFLERRLALGHEQHACIGVRLADVVGGEGRLPLQAGVGVAGSEGLVGGTEQVLRNQRTRAHQIRPKPCHTRATPGTAYEHFLPGPKPSAALPWSVLI